MVYVEQGKTDLSPSPQEKDCKNSSGDHALPDDCVISVEPSGSEMSAVATSARVPVRAVTMEQSSTSSIQQQHFHEKSDVNNYLESSKLYLNHMDCCIRLEKELFELEERSIILTNNGLTMSHTEIDNTTRQSTNQMLAKVYAASCERKRESLKILKRRMCELAYVSDLFSKRIRSNDA
jgi:hypothetical protein